MHIPKTEFLYGAPHIRVLQPYVAGSPVSAIAREFGLEESSIIKLASNENPLGMPPSARDAIDRKLHDGAIYPDPDAFDLKKTIADRMQVPQQWITIGSGSSDLIDVVTRAFVEIGQSVVVSEYAFSAYRLAIAAIDATAIIVPARNFGHDLDAMLHSIKKDTKLIFIANPNNPTGTFHSPKNMGEFLDRVPKTVTVALDEAYANYLVDEDQSCVAELVMKYPNLIVMRTFSKAHGLAGLRVGFAVAQMHLSDLLNRVRLPFNTSTIAQAAATAALNDEEFLYQSRSMNFIGLEQLYRGFQEMNFFYLKSAGNFVLVKVGDASVVYRHLLRDGIIVRPVINYGLPEWLRISVGLPGHNNRLLHSLTTYRRMVIKPRHLR